METGRKTGWMSRKGWWVTAALFTLFGLALLWGLLFGGDFLGWRANHNAASASFRDFLSGERRSHKRQELGRRPGR